MSFLTELRDLCLSLNKIEDLNQFCEVLKTMTNLQSLEFSDIGYIEPNVIVNNLKYLVNLERLDFSHNFIGKESGKLLGENLQSLPNLTYLNLKSNDLEEEGSSSISKSFSSISKLTNLDISSNGIVNIREFSNNLKCLNNLSILNVSFNKIESEGVKELSESFKSITNLTELDLSSNPLTEESSKFICSEIKNLVKITEINLKSMDIIFIYNYLGTNINDSSLQELSSSFSMLKDLKRVVLRDNQISDEGVKVLLENLSDVKGMYIQLGNNENIKEVDKLNEMIKSMNLMCFVFL